MASKTFVGKRKNGQFNFKFRYKVDGKTVSVNEAFDAKKEAEKRLEYYEELEKGGYNPIFADFMKEWYEEFALGHYKRIGNTDTSIKFLNADNISKKRIKEITEVDINKFLDSIKKGRRDNRNSNKIKAVTLNNYYYTLVSLFKYAKRNGYITNNPMSNVESPNFKRSPISYEASEVTANYWKNVLNCARKEAEESKQHSFTKKQFVLLLELALLTGMRAGEIAGLQWKDVNFKSGVIAVKHAMSVKKQLTTTKSEKERTIVITDELVAKLKQHKKDTAHAKMDYVFIHPAQKSDEWDVYNPANLNRRLKRLQERHSLETRNFHQTRHASATLRFVFENEENANNALENVSRFLGHSSQELTKSTYIHTIQAQQAEASKKTTQKISDLLK